MKRGCGVLLHITSLPDGNFSQATKFIDFLERAGVKYWQILAAGPTGASDSPYSPLSVFAGNPKFIDQNVILNLSKDAAIPNASLRYARDPG